MVYIIIYRDMKNRKDKKYVIYEHISPSGKVYVGQSSEVNIRWQGGGNRYLSKNKKGKYVQPYFANALLKYGWENFGHKIILSGLDKSNANYAEKYLIKWYKLKGLSYNITDGGEGGCGLKRTMSPEMRIFMSNYMRKYSPLIGTHRTERQKQMAREKMMGRHPTKEVRIKMSEAHVNKANFWRWKKIYAFDKETKEFVREYDSVSKAAKELGIKIAFENLKIKGYLEYIIENIDNDNIGICYDSGHCHAHFKNEFNWSLFKNKVFAIHLHDNDASDDQHLLPYDGTINWEEVISNLKEANYKGPITLEICYRNEYLKMGIEEFYNKGHEIGNRLAKMLDE